MLIQFVSQTSKFQAPRPVVPPRARVRLRPFSINVLYNWQAMAFDWISPRWALPRWFGASPTPPSVCRFFLVGTRRRIILSGPAVCSAWWGPPFVQLVRGGGSLRFADISCSNDLFCSPLIFPWPDELFHRCFWIFFFFVRAREEKSVYLLTLLVQYLFFPFPGPRVNQTARLPKTPPPSNFSQTKLSPQQPHLHHPPPLHQLHHHGWVPCQSGSPGNWPRRRRPWPRRRRRLRAKKARNFRCLLESVWLNLQI